MWRSDTPINNNKTDIITCSRPRHTITFPSPFSLPHTPTLISYFPFSSNPLISPITPSSSIRLSLPSPTHTHFLFFLLAYKLSPANAYLPFFQIPNSRRANAPPYSLSRLPQNPRSLSSTRTASLLSHVHLTSPASPHPFPTHTQSPCPTHTPFYTSTHPPPSLPQPTHTSLSPHSIAYHPHTLP